MFTPKTLVLTLALTLAAHADPIRVRTTQGTEHGFLEVRATSGEIIGYGDSIQIARGSRVTTELALHFKDGSLDDETATFTQAGTFRLLTDHHIQHGPLFKTPLDMTVDATTGLVTTRSVDKDGKPKVETERLHLPPDISNGIIGPLLASVSPTLPQFRLSMVVPFGKGRLVKLITTPDGEQTFTSTGVQRKAQVFRIKIDLGGIIGVVAPIVGKQPQDVSIWVVEGPAPQLVRVVEQLYDDGPVVSVELAGCTFPH